IGRSEGAVAPAHAQAGGASQRRGGHRQRDREHHVGAGEAGVADQRVFAGIEHPILVKIDPEAALRAGVVGAHRYAEVGGSATAQGGSIGRVGGKIAVA
nr:hypothetical protein [Tanacetum cinerariifolium]